MTDIRPDLDIEEDIELLIRTYAPLLSSVGHFTYKSVDGHVIFKGNVRSLQARRVLMDNVPHIHGVKTVDTTALYDDEMIRIALGAVLPDGVQASVHFGAVVLTGKMPLGMGVADLSQKVSAVPGVKRVANDLESIAVA